MAAPTVKPEMSPPSPEVPRLEPGDSLTRDEFERRYRAMPQIKKAELIEGVVYMPSPVQFEGHGCPQADFIGWLYVYRAHTPGVRVADNTTIRLDLENEPQPDGSLLILPSFGGKARISQDDYLEGAPELVGEVAASSVSIDLNAKLRVYRRNQVLEYLVWRVLDRAVDWFHLRGSDYQRLPLGPDGIIRSEVFPGLWLDVAALVRSDVARVLQVLQQGIGSQEHSEFVARLQQKQGSPG